MDMQDMMNLLTEVEELLPRMVWQRDHERERKIEDEGHEARCFTGTLPDDDWELALIDFDISDQGFPAGTRGCDGGARSTRRGIVLHLTRPLAAEGVRLAIAKTTKGQS
jgi:hypothetical protein